jgi:hypothetical protein
VTVAVAPVPSTVAIDGSLERHVRPSGEITAPVAFLTTAVIARVSPVDASASADVAARVTEPAGPMGEVVPSEPHPVTSRNNPSTGIERIRVSRECGTSGLTRTGVPVRLTNEIGERERDTQSRIRSQRRAMTT